MTLIEIWLKNTGIISSPLAGEEEGGGETDITPTLALPHLETVS